MVHAAHRHGITAAARTFATTRKTVRKWLTTYRVAGTGGLKDRSRAPGLSRRPWPFTKLQLGVKDLEDIPIYWPQMRRLALPPHQLTCRGLRRGDILRLRLREHDDEQLALPGLRG